MGIYTEAHNEISAAENKPSDWNLLAFIYRLN